MTTVGEMMARTARAVPGAIKIEAKKLRLNQGKDGWLLTLLLHPDDYNTDLAIAPIGAQFDVLMVKCDEETGAVPEAEVASEEPAAGTTPPEKRQKTRAELAGILCNDVRFQRWIFAQFDERPAEGASKEDLAANAADHVRSLCRVTSRAEFGRSDMAASRWASLYARYRQETGLDPESRGG